MPKITKRFVEKIIPHSANTLKYWDAELKGFGVVVLPSGRRTYCLQYRNNHRTLKRLKIGVHGQITVEEARILAKKHLGNIAHGEDPASKKRENRTLPTINELACDYRQRHGQQKRLKSLEEDQRLLKKIILPLLGHLKVKGLLRREIESLHLSLKSTPYQANRTLALFLKCFLWQLRGDGEKITL